MFSFVLIIAFAFSWISLYCCIVSIYCRTALDRAEKAQERLNTVSQEVVKVLETVNPKEAKRYLCTFTDCERKISAESVESLEVI